MIKLKRIYEPYSKDDGYRILIDRLWPRGVSKEKAHMDLWLKEIAPENKLRKWFGHDPNKWKEFEKRYKSELKNKKNLLNQIKTLEQKNKTITLLYGAKDTIHNQAIILSEILG